MSILTFPSGYTPDANGVQGMGNMVTTEQLFAQNTWKRMHPEFQRRVYCLMGFAASQGRPLGVGTGWRIQPDDGRPGFASPGNSNHEGFPDLRVEWDMLNGDKDAVAADMVPNLSWDWMEPHLAAFHLRSFRNVNSEPWHLQPLEIPASRSRDVNGVLLPHPRRVRWDLASPVLPWPPPAPPLPPEVSDVQELFTCNGSTFAACFPFVAVVPDGTTLTAIKKDFPGVPTRAVSKPSFKAFILVGRRPGGTWTDADFNTVFRQPDPPPPPTATA